MMAQTYSTAKVEFPDGSLKPLDPGKRQYIFLNCAAAFTLQLDELSIITKRIDFWMILALFYINLIFFEIVTDLTAIMANSRNYEDLKYAWKGWHESAGRPVKDDYEEFVILSNRAREPDGTYID